MSKARLVITAVVLEGRSQADVARSYGVSQACVSRPVARFRSEGDAAFEPRSRRPNSRPNATPTATVYRIIRRAELVTPEPRTEPKSSYIRFQAEQPNETWQADYTHHRLADSTDIDILTRLDDHARYALSVTAHPRVTGRTVVDTFRAATEQHGIPFSTLTDSGSVFTTRFSQGGLTSRYGFETELVRLRVRRKNPRPNHPTTCGNVERFQLTMKRWLRAQP